MLSHFLRTVAADDDPNFRNVTLLLPGNGTNGAQNNTFLDSGTANGGVGFTITRNGNPTQGTFTAYGPNWSNYFDGNGDYLTVPDNAAYATGTNNFTLEGWIYPTQTSSAAARIISQQGAAGYWVLRQDTNTIVYFYFNASTSATVSLNSGAVLTPNLWYHIAVVRNGNTFTMYVNGVSVSTGTSSGAIPDIARVVAIGAYFETVASEFFTGNISNIRLTTGASAALYTADFTPPSQPLTAVTGTVLLTCQSNRFIDNSSNAFTVTRNGDVRVQRFSPFNPTGPYESTVIGGSGYFDGSGDFVSAPDNAAFEIGSSNFTVEAWVYLTAYSTVYSGSFYAGTVFGKDSTASRGFQFNLSGTASSWTGINCLLFSSNTVFTTTSASFTFLLNTWYHLAWVRNGTSVRIYVNGVDIGGGTNSVTVQNSTPAVTVGALNYPGFEYYVPGYISNFRFVNGTAVYTANFTPPSAPVTAVTNTSLLLNFTNAGIIDNAMMNDLETIGGAQISTARSIFGGSSTYCDSSGDYLFIPGKNEVEFGAGDFTIEFWINWTAVPSVAKEYRLWYPANHATGFTRLIIYVFQNSLVVGWFGTNVLGTLYSWNANQWYHIAVTRSGNTWRLFRDGVVGGTATNSTTLAVASGYRIGDQCDAYFDDYRVTKGIARYTANFTPPVRPYPTR